MAKIIESANSGGKDPAKTPAGSTSPIRLEWIVSQENTDDLHLKCKLDPEHPGEWRCTQAPGPVVPKAVSPVNTPSVEPLTSKTDGEGSKIPVTDGIEIWNRNNGDTMRVKRVEHEGNVLFLPIATTPQQQPVNLQATTVKNAKQDPAVGRTQMSQCGSGSKGFCKLTGMRSSTSAKKNDQNSGGT